MKTPTVQQVEALSIEEFFTYVARLMKTNPPAAQDGPMVARMAKIGLVPGQDFDSSRLGAFERNQLKPFPSWD